MLLNSINSLLLTGPRKSEFQPKKLFTNVQAKKRLFVGVVSENRKGEGYPWTPTATPPLFWFLWLGQNPQTFGFENLLMESID